jgi:hypothetical protein
MPEKVCSQLIIKLKRQIYCFGGRASSVPEGKLIFIRFIVLYLTQKPVVN